MDVAHSDQVSKALRMADSRRLVINGLTGGILGLGRFRSAAATHRDGHHCTPSHNHACPDGQTCRAVNGEWACQDICRALAEVCATDDECCAGLRCCPDRRCASAADNCDGLD